MQKSGTKKFAVHRKTQKKRKKKTSKYENSPELQIILNT